MLVPCGRISPAAATCGCQTHMLNKTDSQNARQLYRPLGRTAGGQSFQRRNPWRVNGGEL